MKILTLSLLVSFSAMAQMPKFPSVPGVKDLSQQVLDACKEDKSKISSCESYTEFPKIKACLLANESKLSEKCKKSLKLVK